MKSQWCSRHIKGVESTGIIVAKGKEDRKQQQQKFPDACFRLANEPIDYAGIPKDEKLIKQI